MRFWLFILLPFVGWASPMQQFQLDTVLMGSAFNFTAIHEDVTVAKKAVRLAKKEVIRIETTISSWQSNSETSLINRNAGITPVKVSSELINLIQRAVKISKMSSGYFDITFASLKPVWDFNKTYTDLPDARVIKESIQLINYKNIEVTDSTVFLTMKGMKLDFGAIGKGYAANKAKAVMYTIGIHNGVVNAGGDLINWGLNIEVKFWGQSRNFLIFTL